MIYKEVIDWIKQQRQRKLELLAVEFNIDKTKDGWVNNLLRVIAEHFIDGLCTSHSKKWGRTETETTKYIELVVEIDRLRKQGVKITDACRALVRRDGPWKGANEHTLETTYHRTAKRIKKQFEAPDDHPLYARLLEIRDR